MQASSPFPFPFELTASDLYLAGKTLPHFHPCSFGCDLEVTPELPSSKGIQGSSTGPFLCPCRLPGAALALGSRRKYLTFLLHALISQAGSAQRAHQAPVPLFREIFSFQQCHCLCWFPLLSQAGSSAQGDLAGMAQPWELGGWTKEDGGDMEMSCCCAGVRQHHC